MFILIEHNSDEIGRVFKGYTLQELLEDILFRMEDNEEIEEFKEDYSIEKITIEFLQTLHHDGDSSYGYTLRRI